MRALQYFQKVYTQSSQNKVVELFNHYKIDDSEHIALQDAFLFYRDLFESTGLKVYEKYDDEQQFFYKTNSYTTLFNMME